MLGTSLNKTVRYNPYVKEGFLTAIPQSPRRDIQPCIVSNVNFSFIVIFIDWQKRGLGLNIPTDLRRSVGLV